MIATLRAWIGLDAWPLPPFAAGSPEILQRGGTLVAGVPRHGAGALVVIHREYGRPPRSGQQVGAGPRCSLEQTPTPKASPVWGGDRTATRDSWPTLPGSWCLTACRHGKAEFDYFVACDKSPPDQPATMEQVSTWTCGSLCSSRAPRVPQSRGPAARERSAPVSSMPRDARVPTDVRKGHTVSAEPIR